MKKSKNKFRIDLGWIVLFGPMFIVVFLFTYDTPEFLAEHSSSGAASEADVHTALGRSAMKNGRLDEAFKQFTTALSMYSEIPEAWMNIGLILNEQGKTDQAIQAMNKALAMNPVNKEMIYNNVGLIYAEQKDYEKAMAMFQESAAAFPSSAAVYRNIGNVYMAMENWEGTAGSFIQAISNKPTLWNLYEAMRREAVERMKADEKYDEFLTLYGNEANYDDLTEFDETIIKELNTTDPKIAADYRNLGRAFSKLGKIEQAAKCYKEALRITPIDAGTCNKLGILYGRMGDYESACEQFKAAIEIDAGYEDALNNLKHCERMLGGE
jgi:tetratricopeptide (TPR) repeat protein